jgi:hypothetical protein
MCFGPDGKPDILIEGLVHDRRSYQQGGLAPTPLPSADACYPERKNRTVRFDHLDLLAEAEGPAIQLEMALRRAIAAHSPFTVHGKNEPGFVRLSRPVAPDYRPVRVLGERILVDEVVVIERKLDKIPAAHRAGREFPGAVKLEANGPPIIHGLRMANGG